MKISKKNRYAYVLMTAFVAVGICNISFITRNKDVSNFSFLIETAKDGLKLSSKGGTAWKELSFSINNEKIQAIDQYGMTTIEKETKD